MELPDTFELQEGHMSPTRRNKPDTDGVPNFFEVNLKFRYPVKDFFCRFLL